MISKDLLTFEYKTVHDPLDNCHLWGVYRNGPLLTIYILESLLFYKIIMHAMHKIVIYYMYAQDRKLTVEIKYKRIKTQNEKITQQAKYQLSITIMSLSQ